MDYKFLVDKVGYERETETVCITTTKEELIEVCKTLSGEDFNVTVFENNSFVDIFMGMSKEEILNLP